MTKLRVGIIGATGMVGQYFISLLQNHPWFNIVLLAASENSADKTYSEAVKGRWLMDGEIPSGIAGMKVYNAFDVKTIAGKVDFVFSAISLDKKETAQLEEKYAKYEIPVVSNNSAHRWTPDVPMVIPEVNSKHLEIITTQRHRLSTRRGFIATKPNCSIQSYVPAIYALRDLTPFKLLVTTYQAVSGAGKKLESWPEMEDNVIPYISGEEEKSEQEPLKILGSISHGCISKCQSIVIASQCIRVPVSNGHMAAVFMSTIKKVDPKDIIARWRAFKTVPQQLHLPSAPNPFLTYFDEENRPQTKLDRNLQGGMGIAIGRLREDTIFDLKFVTLSHNTIRGAAGGAILLAELLKAQGYI
jgi:aspartate-semialdehyde dehydrogenase